MNGALFCLAINTSRDVFRQPLFYVITGVGMFLTFLSLFFTLFAFGEEIRLMKEMGISTITVCCLVLVSMSAANALSKERESCTILTLLAKPVCSRDVVLGKFFGILIVATVEYLILGAFLVASLSLKNLIDLGVALFPSIIHFVSTTFLPLFYTFLQIEIMCAIAIAGSVYLSVSANLSCCVFVYIVGNLLGLVQNLFNANERHFLWLFAFLYTIFPNLEGVSAISMGYPSEGIDVRYILLMVVYAIAYTTLIIHIAFEMFERKECC
ncbi:ABC-2 family transporter protein [Candidatus Kuenenia stuttgartiensis]|uniref:ABC-2 family transporter protein n=1 Tax=Kuenenia stuttgartiensis TaxID=174633 RepID=A0A6G7GK75_KUEST|nr:ABC transporter permease subunit [Candidatus Kuenenia stuttgartiensis]QII09988.1 ABC-2 family transporter protein [Candidatus Kuenenia stuttgartiensis]